MAQIGPMLIAGLVLETPSQHRVPNHQHTRGISRWAEGQNGVQKVLVTCESLPAHN